RDPDSIGSFTLFEIFFDSMSSFSDLQTPRAIELMLAMLGSMLTVFYPVILVLMVKWRPSAAGRAGGAGFIVGGLLGALGALITWIGDDGVENELWFRRRPGAGATNCVLLDNPAV